MGVLEDMLKALDRISGWKRLQQVPSEVDELSARVAALEEKLGGKRPADVCRYRGERGARLHLAIPRPKRVYDRRLEMREVRADRCPHL